MGVATIRCYAAIIACWIANSTCGYTMGYPSTALPDIASGKYGFVFPSSAVAAWYISCTPIASFVGSLFAFQAFDKYGRRLPLMVMMTLSTVGWMVTVLANGVTLMFVGRILLSLSDTVLQHCFFMFMSELMPKQIRGLASFGLATSFLAGVSLSYIAGAFLSWRWTAVVVIGMKFVATTSIWLFLPETPRWLIMNGEREFAKENLRKLRRYSTNFEDKIEADIVEMEQSLGINESKSFWNVLGRLTKPPLLRPFVILCFCSIFQQLSGSAYIKSYTVKIFELGSGTADHSNSGLLGNPRYQTIIVGLSGVLGGLLSIPSADRLGRRPCLITSGSLVTMSLAIMSVYFWLYQSDESWAVTTIGWLPLLGLFCFNIGYGIGYCAGPATLSNEMLPTSVRAKFMPIGCFIYSATYFFVVQIFGGLDIAPHVMFTTYACIGAIGVLMITIFIPETKNKSLESIEKMWISKSGLNTEIKSDCAGVNALQK